MSQLNQDNMGAFQAKLKGATAEEIIARLKERLAGYKVPKQIHFVDELPRNVMGKVQKNELRQLVSEPDGTKNATEGAAS